MIVRHFLKWAASAGTEQRAKATNALARALLVSDLSFDDRIAAEAALTLLLDDPSPKVRRAMADAFGQSPRAPQQIVSILAADQPDIAGFVLVASPLLSDGELIERIEDGNDETQCFIAERCRLASSVAAAIAEIGCLRACHALISNSSARVSTLSLRTIAERFGTHGAIRQRLLSRGDIGVEIRHFLLVEVSRRLAGSALMQKTLGQGRAGRVLRESCHGVCLDLIDRSAAGEFTALAEHMRLRGDLTEAFLVEVAVRGKLDFLGAALATLSGHPEGRVSGLMSRGRTNALRALALKCGLSDAASFAIVRSLRLWREVARGTMDAGVQEISYRLQESLRTEPSLRARSGSEAITTLVRSIHLQSLRGNARKHALALAAA